MVYLLALIIGTGVGWLIGRAKRRPVLGLVLGFLLSWIGWIIVACIPAKAQTY
jgi:hypothetical protein